MKEFKAESKRLLDLMINSIYTHKEIFLRELISNASDAIDKLHFKSLTDSSIKTKQSDYQITITIDKESRTLTVSDNGIGMTESDMESNLGTIAKSGSLDFKQENKDTETDIIGQFGVGFYSAFMVSDSITVISRNVSETTAHKWVSSGADGYDITPSGKASAGTDVIMQIKENDKDENYDKYLSEYELAELVKKYSDYIKYPIKMEMTKSRLKEGSDKEYEDYKETETINSMVPLWRKNKKDVTTQEYNDFYKHKFNDYSDPLAVIHVKAEGLAMYNTILYVPSKLPYDFYTKDYEKGLQLYANGVLIMDRCGDLLPDCFGFIKGLVDSQDLSLNISRELLQHDRQLKTIAGGIEKKIKSELKSIMDSDREKYEKIYSVFGRSIKMGAVANFGVKKDLVSDLIMAHSSNDGKLTTFPEYVKAMKDGQDVIYYVVGEDIGKLKKLPKVKAVLSKGFEVLYFTDEFDEMMLKLIDKFDGKSFKSVSDSDINLSTDEEKKQVEEKSKSFKDVLVGMEKCLKNKVEKVQLTDRLTDGNAVSLSSMGEISIEMEKFLAQMPNSNGAKAKRVLEINSKHRIVDVLESLFKNDKNKFESYTKLLYNQSLVIEGLPVDDSVEFAQQICDLMI